MDGDRRAWAALLSLLLILSLSRLASAQGPLVPATSDLALGPEGSLLGPAPGEGGSPEEPGGASNDAFLGGHPGVSVGRTHRGLGRPGRRHRGAVAQVGIPQPRTQPEVELPSSIPLALPGTVEDEGPANGLTLDAAIERLMAGNLELRAQFYELPQADADALTASLRANPILYADSQLVPYGNYSAKRPGGPVQYDVNLSYPLDVSRKRQARIKSACQAKRVLEAQYQNAVRIQVGNLYTAFVDVLAARETLRLARQAFHDIEPLYRKVVQEARSGKTSAADLKRIEDQYDNAVIGVSDAEDALADAQETLGQLLNLPPEETDSLELRGSIRDLAPPPPPLDELLRTALESRPDLVAQRLGIARAQADVALARAHRFEDVYVLYQPYTFQNNAPFHAKSSTSWALGVTVPLPIYNRNQGNILRSEYNVTQTQVELAALERRVVAEVRRAAREYNSSKQSLLHIEREMLPHARNRLREQSELMAQGKGDADEYLSSQREYNDFVRQYRDALIRHRRSMLDLNTAVAIRLLP